MTNHPKRRRVPNQLAKSIIDIATGQKPDRDPTPEEQGKHPAAGASELQARIKLRCPPVHDRQGPFRERSVARRGSRYDLWI
jgi:hypothetical protein